jgi:hypothetical protein
MKSARLPPYSPIRVKGNRKGPQSARMGLIFAQRGLAIEHGPSWMLPGLVGLGKAMEMADIRGIIVAFFLASRGKFLAT